jgi:ABC-type uncharacterized transport system substrate-binding protein
MLNRRNLLIALGAGALAVPLGVIAQAQGRIRCIGFLGELDRATYAQRLEAFKAGMRQLDYAESRDYVVESRYADSDLARLPALIDELLALKVDVIISSGTPSTMAARKATSEIPILINTVLIRLAAALPRVWRTRAAMLRDSRRTWVRTFTPNGWTFCGRSCPACVEWAYFTLRRTAAMGSP